MQHSYKCNHMWNSKKKKLMISEKCAWIEFRWLILIPVLWKFSLAVNMCVHYISYLDFNETCSFLVNLSTCYVSTNWKHRRLFFFEYSLLCVLGCECVFSHCFARSGYLAKHEAAALNVAKWTKNQSKCWNNLHTLFLTCTLVLNRVFKMAVKFCDFMLLVSTCLNR